MRPRLLFIPVLSLLLIPAAGAAQHHPDRSPYAEHQDREIKALPSEDVDGLLEGEGMGMALAAELNGYPGPRHVLDLADELELDPSQRREVRRIFDSMHVRATSLGRRIVALERELDGAFRNGSITRAGLQALSEEIGRKRGELRRVHLEAHLELRPLLTEHQRAEYDRLRGYRRHH